jgi:hypothetical protein
MQTESDTPQAEPRVPPQGPPAKCKPPAYNVAAVADNSSVTVNTAVKLTGTAQRIQYSPPDCTGEIEDGSRSPSEARINGLGEGRSLYMTILSGG